MDWKPDRNAKQPIYKQIAEYIENGVADGHSHLINHYLLNVR